MGGGGVLKVSRGFSGDVERGNFQGGTCSASGTANAVGVESTGGSQRISNTKHTAQPY